MDRRTFVKRAALGAGAVALGAGAIGVASSLAKPREPPATVRYFGAHKVGGPAPRGLPYVPIDVRGDIVVARPRIEGKLVESRTLEWLKYCASPIAHPDAFEGEHDEALRYDFPEEALRFLEPWYKSKLGEPIRADDFPGVGFGARFIWRSGLTGVVVKLDPAEIAFVETTVPPGKPITQREEKRLVLEQVFHDGLVAVSNVCTHFCATAGYKEAEALARPREAWDDVFCTAHGSSFDPRQPVAYEYVPEDRAESRTDLAA